eukprot:m.140734 g.140734  ORF g.140734 m.140734 type:complete len:111 (-) comp14038_c0_seq4:3716-4048(-)
MNASRFLAESIRCHPDHLKMTDGAAVIAEDTRIDHVHRRAIGGTIDLGAVVTMTEAAGVATIATTTAEIGIEDTIGTEATIGDTTAIVGASSFSGHHLTRLPSLLGCLGV